MMAMHYRTAISLFTVGERIILSLTPQGSVTNTTFKPPLRAPPTTRKRKQVYIQVSLDLKRYGIQVQKLWYFDIETLLPLSAIWLNYRRLYDRHHIGVPSFYLFLQGFQMVLVNNPTGRSSWLTISASSIWRRLWEIGMATGRVRAGFFHTRTRSAGQDPWPGPDLFTKRIFFRGPDPPPLGRGTSGPILWPNKKKMFA